MKEAVVVPVSFKDGIVLVVGGLFPRSENCLAQRVVWKLCFDLSAHRVVVKDRCDAGFDKFFEVFKLLGHRKVRFILLNRIALVVQNRSSVADPAKQFRIAGGGIDVGNRVGVVGIYCYLFGQAGFGLYFPHQYVSQTV